MGRWCHAKTRRRQGNDQNSQTTKCPCFIREIREIRSFFSGFSAPCPGRHGAPATADRLSHQKSYLSSVVCSCFPTKFPLLYLYPFVSILLAHRSLGEGGCPSVVVPALPFPILFLLSILKNPVNCHSVRAAPSFVLPMADRYRLRVRLASGLVPDLSSALSYSA